MFHFLSILATLLFLGYPLHAVASEESLEGRAEVNFRYGQERSITMTEFWVPFMQNDNSVLYGDLRIMGDNQDNREGNLGVGYRKITEIGGYKGIAGVHGWVDRRKTARRSTFYQATIGAEWLGESFDILANGYIPLSSKRIITVPNANPQGAALVGTGIVIDTDGKIIEEPQHGFDLELGLELGQYFKPIREHTDSFRIYGGGYYFDGDNTENVAGLRARFTADITSDIQIGARFQRDDERGSQGFLEATIRFPFGQKKKYRERGLYARLDDSPERDIDIITGEQITDTGDRVSVFNAQTGAAQEVLNVDNTAAGGGDGSAETPFNTLAAAQAAASAHTVIYVHRGDGTTTGQNAGITLNKEGMQLIGSGANFVYDSGSFTTANGASPSSILIAPATTAPVITNGGGNGITVTADDITVAGLTVDGATSNGVYVFNNTGSTWGNVNVRDITTQDNAQHGIRIESNGAGSIISSVNIQDITTTDNQQRGVFVFAVNSGVITSVTLDTITATDNQQDGVWVYANSGVITSATLDTIIAQDNIWNGVRVESNGAGSIVSNVTMQDITATANQQRGVLVYAQNSGVITAATLDTVIATGNQQHGVWVYALNGGAITAATLDMVTAQNNIWSGVRVESNGAGSIITNVDMQDVTATDNQQHGVRVYTANGGAITAATLDTVTATNNQDHGVLVYALNSGVITAATLDSVTATGNQQHGIFIDDDTTAAFNIDLGGGALGSLGNNSIYGNVGADLRVDLDGGELAAQNNWWGDATGLDPANVTLDGGSTVDTSNFLSVAP